MLLSVKERRENKKAYVYLLIFTSRHIGRTNPKTMKLGMVGTRVKGKQQMKK